MSRACPIAGWYRDPAGEHALRYWDGATWTAGVRNDSVGLRPAWAERPGLARSARARSRRGPGSFPVVVVIGAALMIVGAVLPWREAQVGHLSVSSTGIDGDGALTIVFAAGIVVLLVVLAGSRLLGWSLVALSAAAGAFALYEIVDTSRKAHDLVHAAASGRVTASVGAGPWVVLLGALVALVGAVLALVGSRNFRS